MNGTVASILVSWISWSENLYPCGWEASGNKIFQQRRRKAINQIFEEGPSLDRRNILDQQLDLIRLWTDDWVMELICIFYEDPPLDRILDGNPPLDHARVKGQRDQARLDPDEELKTPYVQHSEGLTLGRHTWDD